jgi:hypothetical protein
MLDVMLIVLVIGLFTFMALGATVLVVDTLVQWKRESKIAKQWKKATH